MFKKFLDHFIHGSNVAFNEFRHYLGLFVVSNFFIRMWLVKRNILIAAIYLVWSVFYVQIFVDLRATNFNIQQPLFSFPVNGFESLRYLLENKPIAAYLSSR